MGVIQLIKKYVAVLLCIVIFLLSFSFESNSVSLGVSASSAIVMSVQTGQVLYEFNAHKKMSMASTTKIMTSLLVLENADLKKMITVKEDELKVEGTSMGLLPGDKVTFEGLVYGMLLQSGNDAANVAAYKIGNSIDGFAVLMNRRAKEIGMNSTNFVTPSGLDDEEHYTTAYDMALLGCEAIKNADFRYICSQKNATVNYGNPPYSRRLTNHNKLLSYYEGCIGMKTGFTKKSGRCLVSAAERDGVEIVAVTLNASDDWNDHKKMLDYGFSVVERRKLDSETDIHSVSVIGGEKSSVSVVPEGVGYVDVNEQMPGISSKCMLDSFVYAPVKKGDVLGRIVYYVDSKEVAEINLTAKESVKAKKIKKKKFWTKVLDFLKGFFKK